MGLSPERPGDAPQMCRPAAETRVPNTSSGRMPRRRAVVEDVWIPVRTSWGNKAGAALSQEGHDGQL